MLAKAKECWEQEHEEREAEKRRYLAERIPTLQTRGLSLSALQVSLAGGQVGGFTLAHEVELSRAQQLCNSRGTLPYVASCYLPNHPRVKKLEPILQVGKVSPREQKGLSDAKI